MGKIRPPINLNIPSLTLCVYCEDNLATSWDHVIPFSKGGASTVQNLVVCCKKCNSRAKDMIFPSFEAKKEYLQSRHHLISKQPKKNHKIIEEVKVERPRFTLATIIKNQTIHVKSGKFEPKGTISTNKLPPASKLKPRYYPKLKSGRGYPQNEARRLKVQSFRGGPWSTTSPQKKRRNHTLF